MKDLTVLSGDDSPTLPMMSVGAEGVISVVGHTVPRDMIDLVTKAAMRMRCPPQPCHRERSW